MQREVVVSVVPFIVEAFVVSVIVSLAWLDRELRWAFQNADLNAENDLLSYKVWWHAEQALRDFVRPTRLHVHDGAIAQQKAEVARVLELFHSLTSHYNFDSVKSTMTFIPVADFDPEGRFSDMRARGKRWRATQASADRPATPRSAIIDDTTFMTMEELMAYERLVGPPNEEDVPSPIARATGFSTEPTIDNWPLDPIEELERSSRGTKKKSKRRGRKS